MSIFYAPQELLEGPINVLLLGAGGTGGDVLDALVRLHHGLIATGHPGGLEVTVMDGDTVSTANVGRQRFGRCDVGHNKALLLTHRVCLLHDLAWEAVPQYCELSADGSAVLCLDQVQLLVSCIDRAAVRVGIARAAAAQRAHGLWLDFGNAARHGQIVLGHLAQAPRGTLRVPHVVDLYPELTDVDDSQAPSCSFEQAIARQDLFINPVLAYTGIALLWNLLRHGQLEHHAAFVDVARPSTQPLAIDRQVWSGFGYVAPSHEAFEDEADDTRVRRLRRRA